MPEASQTESLPLVMTSCDIDFCHYPTTRCDYEIFQDERVVDLTATLHYMKRCRKMNNVD